MCVIPRASTSCSTATAVVRSAGGPNTCGPASCIAPYPMRVTIRSSAIRNVPAAVAGSDAGLFARDDAISKLLIRFGCGEATSLRVICRGVYYAGCRTTRVAVSYDCDWQDTAD